MTADTTRSEKDAEPEDSIARHRYEFPRVEEITHDALVAARERDRVALSLVLRPDPTRDRSGDRASS